MAVASVSPMLKLTGVCPPARAAVIAELIRGSPSATWVVVVEDARTAEAIAEDARFFCASPASKGRERASEGAEFFVFPESIADGRDLREAFSASSDRLNVLSRLRGRLTSAAQNARRPRRSSS
jgi:transcription-repair coupling factor (superfamily II helicase)